MKKKKLIISEPIFGILSPRPLGGWFTGTNFLDKLWIVVERFENVFGKE